MPSRRTVQVLDAALAVWVLLWLWAGVTVDEVGKVSDTMQSASEALDQTADGLDTLSHAPFIGKVARIADRVHETSASTHQNGVETRASVHRFAGLIGFCIFAVPVAPPLLLYAPLRVRRYREDRALEGRYGALAAAQLEHMGVSDALRSGGTHPRQARVGASRTDSVG